MKDEAMTDTDAPEWPDPADKAHAVEQAKWLRNQVAEGGLRFEAYLPPSLALWLLDLVEQDRFLLKAPLPEAVPALTRRGFSQPRHTRDGSPRPARSHHLGL